MACWQAKSSALPRYVAGSLEDDVVHRREIVERGLLLTGRLLISFVLLSIVLSTTSCIILQHPPLWPVALTTTLAVALAPPPHSPQLSAVMADGPPLSPPPKGVFDFIR